jgi:hypothetical protein
MRHGGMRWYPAKHISKFIIKRFFKKCARKKENISDHIWKCLWKYDMFQMKKL